MEKIVEFNIPDADQEEVKNVFSKITRFTLYDIITSSSIAVSGTG